MLKFLAGRYLLFGILGVETLLMPFFLPKETYGEVEFLKFTAFLTQFLLIGAATGFIVRYLKEPVEGRDELRYVFVLGAFLQTLVVCAVTWLLGYGVIALLAFFAMLVLVFESIGKVNENYLLSMSFKPILSLSFITLIPVFLATQFSVENYVLVGFLIAAVIYIGLIRYRLNQSVNKAISYKKIFFGNWVRNYTENIKCGFVVNISTAMVFLFFYIDRVVIREQFPEFLGDYSLSFSIMQLTIVAITAFSYINIVEFGKSQDDIEDLKAKVVISLRKCLILLLILGTASSLLSYFASTYYDYTEVFKTTSLMILLFGLANVLSSLNAVHLYLGSVNKVALLIAVAFLVSVTLNYYIDYSSLNGYYMLLLKTYGIYFIYSLLSFLYVAKKLNIRCSFCKV